MLSAPDFWILVAIGAVMAIVGVLASWHSYKKQKARQAALSTFAASNGIQFLPHGFTGRHLATSEPFDSDWPSNKRFANQLADFEPFRVGDFVALENLLLLQDGTTALYAFDYQCRTQRRDDKRSKYKSHFECGVVVMRIPLLLRKMRLTPDGFLTRVAVPFGVNDISFESEEFNTKYFVSAADVKSVYDILHPRAIDYLLSIPPRDWQFGNMWIVITQTGFFSPEEIGEVFAEIQDFVALIPEYVWQDSGFEPKWRTALDI
ncbi:MAG: hypothetical protein H0W86_04755 [Armatimonadetes bacterium]|nr:hypothetical protein [Armatimonadota bacterium]